MEAQELRIGNFIDFILEGKNEGWTTLESIDNDGVCFLTTQNMIGEIQYFKPIPLTEEWLLKFGYKICEDTVCYFKDKLFIEDWDKDTMNDACNNVKLKYVHQLQNLYFALTGTELEIKS